MTAAEMAEEIVDKLLDLLAITDPNGEEAEAFRKAIDMVEAVAREHREAL